MKRESIIKINGEHYNALTGEKIRDESHKAQPTAKSPAKKRINRTVKQALIAKEIAEEIEEFDQPKRSRAKHQSAKSTRSKLPKWVNNYISGGAPLEIEPDSDFANRAAFSRTFMRATAKDLRRHAQKSETLNRRFVHAPKPQVHSGNNKKLSAPVATHPLVSHFAKAESVTADLKTPVNSSQKISQPKSLEKDARFANSSPNSRIHEQEAKYVPHPIEHVIRTKSIDLKAQKPTYASHATKKRIATSSRTAYGAKFFDDIVRESSNKTEPDHNKILKQALIEEQLNKPIAQLSPREQRAARRLQQRIISSEQPHRHLRIATLITAMIAVLLAGGYLSYVNMPNISLHMAAAQAGVNAKSVSTLDGYSPFGNVNYESGEVTVQYKNNSGGDGYSLTQSKTTLKSSEISGNLLPDGSQSIGDDVHKSGNTAVWIDGNTLFTLDGNRYMTNNQILQIAKSSRS